MEDVFIDMLNTEISISNMDLLKH